MITQDFIQDFIGGGTNKYNSLRIIDSYDSWYFKRCGTCVNEEVIMASLTLFK